VTIRDSVITGNSTVGLRAETFGSATLEHCVITHNGTGIQGDSVNINGQTFFSSTYVSTTLITSNATGISNNGGLLISFGNNRLGANGINGLFTSTIPEK
jgi:hypothetical protein